MDSKYAFGSIILVLGLIFCFFGKKFLIFTEIMTGVILFLFITLYFILSNVSVTLNTWQFWTIVGAACLVGALAGYFISKLEWLPPVILAGFVGFIAGVLLYNLALKYVQSNPTLVYWLCVGFSILIFAIIGSFFTTWIIIVSTSIIGSFAIVRVFFIY